MTDEPLGLQELEEVLGIASTYELANRDGESFEELVWLYNQRLELYKGMTFASLERVRQTFC